MTDEKQNFINEKGQADLENTENQQVENVVVETQAAVINNEEEGKVEASERNDNPPQVGDMSDEEKMANDASNKVEETPSAKDQEEVSSEDFPDDKTEMEVEASEAKIEDGEVLSKDRATLVADLKTLLERNVLEVKDEVEKIKSHFYTLYNEEQRSLRKVAEDAAAAVGEKLEDWQPVADELETKCKELLNTYKSKRADAIKKAEEELNNNLLRKENILSQLKEISEAETADVMDNVKKVKELQAEWKTIGRIPSQKLQETNKQYTVYLEKFYDLVKINFELRDLDFKKNLELKTLLCEAAEKLAENPNAVEASRALQQLHEEWAEIGPVAKELRESIWARFKEASQVINKKHQAYFDELHAKEAENMVKKQAIIEKLKEIDLSQLTNSRLWNEATDKVTKLQEEWRSIGFTPKKSGNAIYEEYRTLCNNFFKAKTAFFKDVRAVFAQNLQKKRSLLDKVEEVKSKIAEFKNNDDWKEATDQIIAIQQEWKTVGIVAKKHADDIWNKFTAACDEFFVQKREILKEAKNEIKRIKDSKVLESGDKAMLLKMRDNLQQQIKIAENNILFFSGKTNTANKLVDDMQKKIDDLKKQLDEIKQKIRNLDADRQQKEETNEA